MRDQTQHVHTDEILERSRAAAGDESTGRATRSWRLASPHRRVRWATAVAAALVVLLVGALLAIVPRSDDTSDVSDDPAPLMLRDDVSQRWSIALPTVGTELVQVGPVALGSDVVVVAAGNRVTALDLVDGRVRWQRQYEDQPLGDIIDLKSFGETVVFSIGARIAGVESDPAAVALSMADGTELWRVSDGQVYNVRNGQVYEYQGLGSDTMSVRLVDPTDGSYLTESLQFAGRDGITTIGSLMVVEGDDDGPTLYDTDRRRSVPFAFPTDRAAEPMTLALAGEELVAIDGEEAVLYDDQGDEAHRLLLPEVIHDAPWITAFAEPELVVVSTGDGSVGIGVIDGRLAIQWEADAAVNPSAYDRATQTDASSPLAVTVDEGFMQPGGVIDLESGAVLPFDGELLWAYVAPDGYAVLTAGVGADDAGTLRAHRRDGEPTWTVDVPAVAEGFEQSALGNDVFVLLSVDRTVSGIRLEVAAYG